MSDAPERIWLDWPDANRGDIVYDEPPERVTQPGQTEYVRADIFEAAIAAALAEGERIGMERAAMPDREMIAFVLWKAEADRAAPNVGRTRTLAGFADESEYTRTKWLSLADAIRAAMDERPTQPEYPSDADIDRSLSTAGLLPDFLKPVDRS